MSVGDNRQFSFVEALMPQAKGAGRLERLSSLVKWYRFEKLLSRLRDEKSAGRPAYKPLLMFKALLLQSLYGLSDMELEEALGDRLVSEGVLEKLFGELDRQLDAAGLILRRGTMLDATIIETTAVRPPTGRNGDLDEAVALGDGCEQEDHDPAGSDDPASDPASDPDARFVRHKGKHGSAYGYKAHVGVDEGSGLIRRIITTPANVNDTVVADRLIVGDEGCVLADGAYHTHAREKALKARGIKPRLMRRPNRHHRVLPPRLARFNLLISTRRAAVETTFATLKNRMGLGLIRYLGLTKATAQVLLAAMAFNMRCWVTLTTPARPHCA